MSFFTVTSLTAGYGKKTIINNIAFSVEKGHILGILGANGSGKTTLLKSICGILPHTGSCTLDGTVLETLSPRQLAQHCSYIPQRSGISLDISVLDVVLMGFNPQLKLLENPDSAMRAAAMEAVVQVGLDGREHSNYLQLSEGQKQLCILARTLVSGSRLFLLDEPESALDFRLRGRMLEILRRQIRKTGGAAVITLHDPMMALNGCDELLLLENGRCTGLLRPSSDPMEEMERQLSSIYGPVSLCVCRDRSGNPHRIMLREQEDEVL